jgi:uncharacterized protein YoxC
MEEIFMTNLELEKKLQGLEQSLSEMQGAIRSLSTQDNNVLSSLNKLSEDVSKLKVDVDVVKRSQVGRPPASISTYK